eukprot:m.162946 g.162946  ORF g.162946 m.162946 type:complete len:690 (-) comp17677_c0_seq1:226-2295(-)
MADDGAASPAEHEHTTRREKDAVVSATTPSSALSGDTSVEHGHTPTAQHTQPNPTDTGHAEPRAAGDAPTQPGAGDTPAAPVAAETLAAPVKTDVPEAGGTPDGSTDVTRATSAKGRGTPPSASAAGAGSPSDATPTTPNVMQPSASNPAPSAPTASEPYGTALVVVDAQQDYFREGSATRMEPPSEAGTLHDVVQRLNALRRARWDAKSDPVGAVVLVREMHPQDHCSFSGASVEHKPHCVAGTPGADWVAGLSRAPADVDITTGTDAQRNSYSAFFDAGRVATSLEAHLRKLNVARLVVCGAGLDTRIASTALDGAELGFSVKVVRDACLCVSSEMCDGMVSRMQSQGVEVVDSATLLPQPLKEPDAERQVGNTDRGSSKDKAAVSKGTMLVEQDGQFVLVESSDLQASDDEGSNVPDAPPSPMVRPHRTQSARNRPKPQRPTSTRPKSARVVNTRMPVGHRSGFKPPPGSQLYKGFHSEEGRDAYEAWLAQKEKQKQREIEQKRRLAAQQRQPTLQERREQAERSFQGWLAQKKTHPRPKTSMQTSPARAHSARNRKEADAEFQCWVDKKKLAAAEARRQEQMKRQIVEENLARMEEHKRRAKGEYEQWLRKKRLEEEANKRRFKQRVKQMTKEARRIKASLATTYTRGQDDDNLAWQKSNSARLRREAQTRQHAVMLSVSLQQLS